MTLTINTNVSSLITQRNLNGATTSLNKAIERMTTGYKINSAKDNAAGCSISNMWNTQISSLDVTADNAATASDLLTTVEQQYSLLTNHLQRIRDLTEQAANGTYGSASLKAIQSEVYARLQEIDRIAANSEFNGIKLMAYDDTNTDRNIGLGITDSGLNIQVGLYSNKDSVINLDISLFKSAAISSLFSGGNTKVVTFDTNGDSVLVEKTLDEILQLAGGSIDKLAADDGAASASNSHQQGLKAFAAACAALQYDSEKDKYYLLSDNTDTTYGASAMLGFIDNAIDEISRRTTAIGAAQNRIDSALAAIDVQSQNLTSSLSTLRDSDVASESSKYIQSQILQQASATLLATANQTPSIALNLV